jgi:hypothetical protein
MIKSESGKVEMRGNVIDLLAELSLIVASLYEVISEYDDKNARKAVLAAATTGFSTYDELKTSSGGISDEMVGN